MQPALGHRRELDGIRGIAIALVVVFHALTPTGFFPGGGTVGVQLFFVLSGFLITSILANEWRSTGRIGVGGFYRARLRRLMPALVVFLAVFALWAFISGSPRLLPVAVAATYVSNWARVAGVDLAEVGHTWSLAVEEQFYLVWPLLLLLVLRSRVPAVAVAIAAVALIAWRVVLTNPDVTWDRIDYATDVNAAALLAGAAIALIGVPATRHGRLLGVERHHRPRPALADAERHPMVERRRPRRSRLPARDRRVRRADRRRPQRAERLARRPPLVFLGAISYALYLWHTGLNSIMADDYGWGVAPRLLLVPASIVIAWASLRWVEAPFRRRRPRQATAESQELTPIPAT